MRIGSRVRIWFWIIVVPLAVVILMANLLRDAAQRAQDAASREALSQKEREAGDARSAEIQVQRAQQLEARRADAARCARLVRPMLHAANAGPTLLVLTRQHCVVGCVLPDLAQAEVEARVASGLQGVWVSPSGLDMGKVAESTMRRPSLRGVTVDACFTDPALGQEDFILLAADGSLLHAGLAAHRLGPDAPAGEFVDPSGVLRSALDEGL